MPFASSQASAAARRALRRRDPNALCALQLTDGCRAVGGTIDYEARAPHPRSFTADHIVATVNGGSDELVNLQHACWECNRRKSAGDGVLKGRQFKSWRTFGRV